METEKIKQAGAELCQAQLSQMLWLKLKSKLAVEVQLLFRVVGIGWSDKLNCTNLNSS